MQSIGNGAPSTLEERVECALSPAYQDLLLSIAQQTCLPVGLLSMQNVWPDENGIVLQCRFCAAVFPVSESDTGVAIFSCPGCQKPHF